MGKESTQELYERFQRKVQTAILRGFPNPNRNGCDLAAPQSYAERIANRENAEAEPGFEHITHCSPCYAEFLTAREQIRAERGLSLPPKPLSRRGERSIARSLRKLEKFSKACGF